MAKRARKRTSRKSAQERVKRICAEIARKGRPINPEELKAIAKRYKYPVGALGALQGQYGYLTQVTVILLTPRGQDAAKGKFRKQSR